MRKKRRAPMLYVEPLKFAMPLTQPILYWPQWVVANALSELIGLGAFAGAIARLFSVARASGTTFAEPFGGYRQMHLLGYSACRSYLGMHLIANAKDTSPAIAIAATTISNEGGVVGAMHRAECSPLLAVP